MVPPTLRVETAEQNANRSSNEIHDALSFLPIFLGVFAAVALIVGAFVIFNTFSITVSQRIREYGLLRTLGASRRQVLASVLVEAALIGLVGAVLGVLGGLLFAKGIEALFNALGIGLPTTALVVADPDGDRRDRDRHRGDPDRGAQPGPSLDSGAADRSDAEPRAHREPPPLDRHGRDRLAADARRSRPGAGRVVRQPEDRRCRR